MKLTDNIYLVGSGEFGISNEYDSNTYLIDGGTDAVLIDSGVGYETNLILKNISTFINTKKLSRVLLTHLHADHCGGTIDFKKQGIDIWTPVNEYNYVTKNKEEVIEAFKTSQRSGGYPKNTSFPEIINGHLIENSEVIQVGNLELQAIQLKGHTPGLMVYLLETNGKRYLFSGDYVFTNGAIGLLNCPGSELSDYRKDIGKLKNLNIDCLFPGHRMPVFRNAQKSIDKAIYNLSLMQIPPTF